MSSSGWRRFAREALLTTGAVLGLVCIVATVAGVAFDVKMLVVQSGSMEPAIQTGALAVAKTVPAADLAIGDVVSVRMESGNRVTHRIVEIEHSGEGGRLSLKGDANTVVDPSSYGVSEADRVVFDVPKAGYVAAWASGPLGIFAGGLLVGTVMLIAFGPGADIRSGPRGRHGAVALLVAGTVGLAVVPGGSQVDGTWAAFADAQTATTGSLTTEVVTRPVQVTCTTSGWYGDSTMTLTTTSPHERYEYVARTFTSASGGTQVGPERVMTATDAQRSLTYPVTEFTDSMDISLYIRVSVRVPGTTWVSPDYLVQQFRLRSILDADVDPERYDCEDENVTDVTGPTLSFKSPMDGDTSSATAFRAAVETACGNERPGCGGISDASGIATVSYRLARTINGTTEYFHAPWYALWGEYNSDSASETASMPTGTTWDFDGWIANAYASAGSYRLEVTASDIYGNTTTSVITFTLT